MKTQLTTLNNANRTCAMTAPVSGRNPVLGLLMRLLWAAALALAAFGAQAAVVFTTLYSFTGTNDGANPNGLVQGSDGYFYGTTYSGGTTNYNDNGSYGYGTVFKISINGVLTTLYTFGTVTNADGDTLDGALPQAALVQGSDGYFYGTTQYGGTTNENYIGTYGYGTVFRISTNGALSSLYSFGSVQDTNALPLDGAYPAAGLVQASDGNFYGTTSRGGNNNFWQPCWNCFSTMGYGTVFRISPNGALATLYAFGSITADEALSGASPNGLVQGRDGHFYGTTQLRGLFTGVPWHGSGTVFNISTNGALSSLYSFGSVQDTNGFLLDGAHPVAGLVQGRDGYFYGTTQYGGTNYSGTVFRISTNGVLTSLYSFTGGNDGANPAAALVQGSDGFFYGTTSCGGTNNAGTVFRLTIVPAPQLSIIPSGPYVILTWPTNSGAFSYAGYTLQSTTNLVSPVWSSVSPGPVVIGGQNVVINTISGTQRLYRLISP